MTFRSEKDRPNLQDATQLPSIVSPYFTFCRVLISTLYLIHRFVDQVTPLECKHWVCLAGSPAFSPTYFGCLVGVKTYLWNEYMISVNLPQSPMVGLLFYFTNKETRHSEAEQRYPRSSWKTAKLKCKPGWPYPCIILKLSVFTNPLPLL